MAGTLSAVFQGRYTTHWASHRRSGWPTGLVPEFDCEAKGGSGRFRKAVEANRSNRLERGSASRLPVDGLCACPGALGVGDESAVAARSLVLSRPDTDCFAGSAGAAFTIGRFAQPRDCGPDARDSQDYR